MTARLRLDLIVRRYPVEVDPDSPGAIYRAGLDAWVLMLDRWTWRLWSGSRIVATSGSQLYSRRIDCARGAEIGAGLEDVVLSTRDGACTPLRHAGGGRWQGVELTILDERGMP